MVPWGLEGRKKWGRTKKNKEIFRSDGYVHYLGCSDNFMDVFIFKLTNCTL